MSTLYIHDQIFNVDYTGYLHWIYLFFKNKADLSCALWTLTIFNTEGLYLN